MCRMQFYTVNATHCIVRWKTNAMIESYGPQSLTHYRFMMHYSSVGVMVDMHFRRLQALSYILNV